ncbi:unnamed protein product [Dibothriocephalus latus]|uniref:Uncharacterized protein n=1 Tax=Dibothriocephalus latus TaxID=60516 RepID=A0A3P7LG09_DIBLA|nr:unnamed protein product [Dibothriocephalus latus]
MRLRTASNCFTPLVRMGLVRVIEGPVAAAADGFKFFPYTTSADRTIECSEEALVADALLGPVLAEAFSFLVSAGLIRRNVNLFIRLRDGPPKLAFLNLIRRLVRHWSLLRSPYKEPASPNQLGDDAKSSDLHWINLALDEADVCEQKLQIEACLHRFQVTTFWPSVLLYTPTPKCLARYESGNRRTHGRALHLLAGCFFEDKVRREKELQEFEDLGVSEVILRFIVSTALVEFLLEQAIRVLSEKTTPAADDCKATYPMQNLNHRHVVPLLYDALREILRLQGVDFEIWSRQLVWQRLQLPKSICSEWDKEEDVDLDATAITFDPDSSTLMDATTADISLNMTMSSVMLFAFLCVCKWSHDGYIFF